MTEQPGGGYGQGDQSGDQGAVNAAVQTREETGLHPAGDDGGPGGAAKAAMPQQIEHEAVADDVKQSHHHVTGLADGEQGRDNEEVNDEEVGKLKNHESVKDHGPWIMSEGSAQPEGPGQSSPWKTRGVLCHRVFILSCRLFRVGGGRWG